ncbi:hypothetical protein J6590_097347 [Homalodisca vitripennis]|nr:hypothetical protein J6590_097347 [Homalodisca vitripennis]
MPVGRPFTGDRDGAQSGRLVGGRVVRDYNVLASPTPPAYPRYNAALSSVPSRHSIVLGLRFSSVLSCHCIVA